MADDNKTEDMQNTPSQAEGEENPGEQSNTPHPTPSQAEGDLETVEEDLQQKGQ